MADNDTSNTGGQQTGSGSNAGQQTGSTGRTDFGQQQANQGTGTGNAGGQQSTEPPWGDDPKQFDPDKAWSLIKNLRSDKDKLVGERDQYKNQVDEAERAKLSEQQKAEADRDSHKSRAEKAELDLLRMNVGLDKGLSAAQSRRLVGATKADLEADADAMIEENGGTGQQQPATRKPREQLRGGGNNNEQEPQETDPAKLAAKIPR